MLFDHEKGGGKSKLNARKWYVGCDGNQYDNENGGEWGHGDCHGNKKKSNLNCKNIMVTWWQNSRCSSN